MLDYIMQNPLTLLHILTALVTLAAALAAVTPSQTDDKVLNAILDVINALAINVGKAKNADLLTSKYQAAKNIRDKVRKTLHTDDLSPPNQR